jgi:predicted phosphoribosyltransferase
MANRFDPFHQEPFGLAVGLSVQSVCQAAKPKPLEAPLQTHLIPIDRPPSSLIRFSGSFEGDWIQIKGWWRPFQPARSKSLGRCQWRGIRVLNQALIGQLGLTSRVIDSITARERREIERRERLYRDDRPPLAVGGRTVILVDDGLATVILVDDGLATGATMLAAARALRIQRPKKIIVAVAVPVASHEACEEFRRHVDEIVCAETPEPFYAVGSWYEDFSQTSDAEVRASS